MTIMAYAPFARGLITGSFDPHAGGDTRGSYERFSAKNYERNLRLLDPARAIAADRNVSLACLAVAWVLAKGAPLIPFPGCKNRRHLDDVLSAPEIALSGDEMRALDDAFPADSASGGRYAAAQLAAWHGA